MRRGSAPFRRAPRGIGLADARYRRSIVILVGHGPAAGAVRWHPREPSDGTKGPCAVHQGSHGFEPAQGTNLSMAAGEEVGPMKIIVALDDSQCSLRAVEVVTR